MFLKARAGVERGSWPDLYRVGFRGRGGGLSTGMTTTATEQKEESEEREEGGGAGEGRLDAH